MENYHTENLDSRKDHINLAREKREREKILRERMEKIVFTNERIVKIHIIYST
jgi:hypothetical protein